MLSEIYDCSMPTSSGIECQDACDFLGPLRTKTPREISSRAGRSNFMKLFPISCELISNCLSTTGQLPFMAAEAAGARLESSFTCASRRRVTVTRRRT